MKGGVYFLMRAMATDDDREEARPMMRTTTRLPSMTLGALMMRATTRMSRMPLAACEAVLLGIAWVLLGIDWVLLRIGIDLHGPPPDEDY